MIKVSKNWTKEKLRSELFKAGGELGAADERMKAMRRSFVDRQAELNGIREDLTKRLAAATIDLSRKDHEVWVLRDLIVTLYNDRER